MSDHLARIFRPGSRDDGLQSSHVPEIDLETEYAGPHPIRCHAAGLHVVNYYVDIAAYSRLAPLMSSTLPDCRPAGSTVGTVGEIVIAYQVDREWDLVPILCCKSLILSSASVWYLLLCLEDDPSVTKRREARLVLIAW